MTDEHDQPTAPALDLRLDELTTEEVEFLAGICDALAHKHHPVVLGPSRKVLERIGLKLQAHRRAKEGA